MFKKLFYKQCYVSGIHPACPKCKTSYLKAKELGRKKTKTRTNVYMLCKCGCKYKYHMGL